jgi:hypothetical protein
MVLHATKSISQLGKELSILLVILLCGCNRECEPAKWQYETFDIPNTEYEKAMKEEGSIKIAVKYHNSTFTNTDYTPEQAMADLGDYGWEFVWQRGNKYLVKRPFTTNYEFRAWVEYEKAK